MRNEEVKTIKEIASKLPTVYEQCMSGYTKEWDNDKGKAVPNVYNVEVNHERRLRKAYKARGMEGILQYLDWIQSLQAKRVKQVEEQKEKTDA